MLTLTEGIIIALITAVTSVVAALLTSKSQVSKVEDTSKTAIALLEKQAVQNKDDIREQREELLRYVEKHEDSHALLLNEMTAIRNDNKALTTLVEQVKTVFKNQEKTDAKVDKLDDKMDQVLMALVKDDIKK
ncbi:hypothetical protein [Culicoidibacter larvae]|uniref:Uncharacterized protein n=1 Tax=Culicoidibacter larvae TaxID=2579976 RepID=A0A5R8Q8A3_9FIRM|nr:hypothetical protein [Culicoidibacter larvae]TLG71360.1 hypothetical protein FEZ08_10725 [Culicoidibacter larvae]